MTTVQKICGINCRNGKLSQLVIFWLGFHFHQVVNMSTAGHILGPPPLKVTAQHVSVVQTLNITDVSKFKFICTSCFPSLLWVIQLCKISYLHPIKVAPTVLYNQLTNVLRWELAQSCLKHIVNMYIDFCRVPTCSEKTHFLFLFKYSFRL